MITNNFDNSFFIADDSDNLGSHVRQMSGFRGNPTLVPQSANGFEKCRKINCTGRFCSWTTLASVRINCLLTNQEKLLEIIEKKLLL